MRESGLANATPQWIMGFMGNALHSQHPRFGLLYVCGQFRYQNSGLHAAQSAHGNLIGLSIFYLSDPCMQSVPPKQPPWGEEMHDFSQVWTATLNKHPQNRILHSTGILL